MTNSSLADLTVKSLIERIGSAGVSPGAGAAGAAALALGAACATKAVSISLKHAPGEARLMQALPDLENLCALALHEGDVDSAAFRDFMKSRSTTAAAKLVDSGEAVGHLIEVLFQVIARVEPCINPTMKGDIVAAKALAAAAKAIQSSNEAEIEADPASAA